VANEAPIGHQPTVERLGRYEILGEIASGGMATVFLGRVTGAKGFQRLVAIKRLHPHLESEEEFVSMFLDEARLAAKIRHPNVVGTLDVEDDEHLYLVMEYVEGDRLLALLRHSAKTGEKIPPAVAVRISMDTLAGLHAAHELCDDDGSPIGLVHRDVSPQNILVSVDGSVKLVDFGIAKASARLSVTRDGQLKGKIAYMAPEQTKRSEIDRRVDVFAMGIITWEMLTAKKLFNGESDVEVLNQLLFEPIPRLREVAPTVPASLDSVVARSLERDPAKRFSTAAEFADALERASKIFGGPAATKTIAAHLQKVSGDKIAKDRARVLAGAPPVPDNGATPSGVKRRATGQFSVPSFTNPGAPISPAPAPSPAAPPPRKATMVGLGGALAPPPPSRPSTPSFDAGPSLLDDDEDVPTSAIVRADVSKSLAAMMGPPKPSTASALYGVDSLDDEPTSFEPVAVVAEPTSTARDAVSAAPVMNPGASLLAPTASPRAMTQQLPAVGAPVVGPPPVATVPVPAPSPSAISIETPFEVPAPRAEAPKSKAGLFVGVAVALLLLGGGGAAAVMKITRQNAVSPTATVVSTPPATPVEAQPRNSGAPVENTQPATNNNGGTAQPATPGAETAANNAPAGNGAVAPTNAPAGNGAPPTADPSQAAAANPPANPPANTTTPVAGNAANPTANANPSQGSTPSAGATTPRRRTGRRTGGTGAGSSPGGGGDDLFGGTPY
jgi:serine/threonine-protein kinase